MNKLRMHSDFPVKTFSNVLDEIFNRSLGDFVGFDSTHSVPAVNIKETDDQYIFEMAAPGFDKTDFNTSNVFFYRLGFAIVKILSQIERLLACFLKVCFNYSHAANTAKER